ncbi:MAG: hypothetical protein V1886_03315 [archaeon]
MDMKVGMIAAVSEVLRFRKQNLGATEEDILQHISEISTQEKDKVKKMGMIAAASRAIRHLERNPGMPEKEVIKRVFEESGEIAGNIDLSPKK